MKGSLPTYKLGVPATLIIVIHLPFINFHQCGAPPPFWPQPMAAHGRILPRSIRPPQEKEREKLASKEAKGGEGAAIYVYKYNTHTYI